MSGKLRSGIATYYRILPVVADAQKGGNDGQDADLTTIDVLLRFEGIEAEDATAELSTSDGARFVDGRADHAWRLRSGQASQVSVRIAHPPGSGYLNVFTHQQQRRSVRSIPLVVAVPGASPSPMPMPSAAPVATYDRGARGEPIVRMTASP